MAVYRPTPICNYCGKAIAKAIYRDESDLPISMQLIGDTLLDGVTHNAIVKVLKNHERN